MNRVLCMGVLVAAGCGPTTVVSELQPQKPFLFVSVDTNVAAGAKTTLPPVQRDFELATTFDFDNDCVVGPGTFTLRSRADAAPELEIIAGPWKVTKPNTYEFSCPDTADGPCLSEGIHIQWAVDGARFDAQPGRKSEGLPGSTHCIAEYAADALNPEQTVMNGTCTNLSGIRGVTGEKPKLGPVKISFTALCRRTG